MNELEQLRAALAKSEAELSALRSAHLHGCECSAADACEFILERNAARAALVKLQALLRDALPIMRQSVACIEQIADSIVAALKDKP